MLRLRLRWEQQTVVRQCETSEWHEREQAADARAWTRRGYHAGKSRRRGGGRGGEAWREGPESSCARQGLDRVVEKRCGWRVNFLRVRGLFCKTPPPSKPGHALITLIFFPPTKKQLLSRTVVFTGYIILPQYRSFWFFLFVYIFK